MTDYTYATPAPLLMLPITAFYSVLQEFARSWHRLQAYTNSLQQENQQLRHENQRLLREVEELHESQLRQKHAIGRQNAMISMFEESTSGGSGVLSQQPAVSDGGLNYVLTPTCLLEDCPHKGPEALEEIFDDHFSMRKGLKRKAEDIESYSPKKAEQMLKGVSQ